MSIRIALASATPHDKCETFVKAHIERLQDVVLVLMGGSLPETDADGKWLMGITKWDLFVAFLRRVLLRQDRKALLRRRIMQLLRKHRIEVVLAEYGVTATEMLPCCMELGIPLVTHFHGFDVFDRDVVKRMGNYQALLKHGAGSVVVSGAMEKRILELGAPPDRLLLNRCGVDLDRFAAADPGSAPPTFVSVGRFAHTKAPNLLLAAFRRVIQARPPAKLVMVGDGPLWESCIHYAKAEGLNAHVQLVGRLDHVSVAKLMANARAFVQHSVTALNGDSEGTPVAVLEAMSSGLPVIATRHMGIGETVVEGVTGLLCEEHDVETMAQHMITVIDDPALAGRMGAAGRKRAIEFHGMDQSIKHLQEFLERSARRPA